jgi:hypothetical protein
MGGPEPLRTLASSQWVSAHVQNVSNKLLLNCAKGSTSQDHQHCCCVDRTELVLGCGIPEVLSMLFLMSRVKSRTPFSFRRVFCEKASSDT